MNMSESSPEIFWGCRMCASAAAGGVCTCVPIGLTRSYRDVFEALRIAEERLHDIYAVFEIAGYDKAMLEEIADIVGWKGYV